MDGDAGLAGWRWIYIIVSFRMKRFRHCLPYEQEGIASAFVAILSFALLMDLPAKGKMPSAYTVSIYSTVL